MNILLLGSGGREHALARKIAQSPQLTQLYTAPGNPGTASCGTNVALNPNNFEAVKNFALTNQINHIVVGPEEPLVKGIADFIAADPHCSHISVIGPNKSAAQLEGSKDFAKRFMQKYNIPTAAYQTFAADEFNKAVDFLKTLKPPYVLKADGLAAGKGVVICESLSLAEKELHEMLCEKKFGEASNCVVIEEFLEGVELSVFVATDGISYKMLPHAKDYKKIGENDTGLNTGGMGAVSPVPFANSNLMSCIEEKVIEPTISGLKNEKIDYRGFIFFGLMIVGNEPYVIEYNVRLGDPETEVILPLVKSDMIDLFNAIAHQKLSTCDVQIIDSCATTVMLVSGGYPLAYEKNKKVFLPGKTAENCIVFHAGTKKDENGTLVTNGGRVIAVTALGKTLEEALNTSYQNVGHINFENMYYRKDIGKDMLKMMDM